MRGYFGVTLIRPKVSDNIGGAIRATHAFGGAFINLVGARHKGFYKTDTSKGYKHLPIFESDELLVKPYHAKLIAVDLVEGAVELMEFEHPESAIYVFGPEDGTLRGEVLEKCDHKVMIPTRLCMNLAATVNVVLYDRLKKSNKKAAE